MMARATIGLLAFFMTSVASAQVIIPGADGSDGAFNPTSSVEIRLDLAPTAAWNAPNPNPGAGLGVYDADKWAIVFRYSSVNIPAGVTVTFFNHPANPPVVWLVDGDVTINGTLNLNASGVDLGFRLGGPGGFRGGGDANSDGLGPGGGTTKQGGSHATGLSPYGNSRALPLIGGSGGARNFGHGGGGAILIASQSTITINGLIEAEGTSAGGSNGGAGGAIRLVCDSLLGIGDLSAIGGLTGGGNGVSGGTGRIRIEANEIAFSSTGSPIATLGLPGETAQLWPEDLAEPSPSITLVKLVDTKKMMEELIPADPRASFEFPFADVNLEDGTMQTLVIEAQNIPTGTDPPGVTAWDVVARIVPREGGPSFTVTASYVSGDFSLSSWEAVISLIPDGFSAIQVRASCPEGECG